ncbi:MAG TPA: hypothetical protein VKG92_09660 [Flavobacteriales bacterium]|nr:hypothetical protein [Flavobacteriales bacterium]
MRLLLVPLIASCVGLCSCDRVGEKAKDALNKGGELAGSAATEVIEGVATGVEETWSVDVHLSDDLRAKGLAIGRTQVENDSSGRDNRLVVYLSAASAITDTLTATAFDQDGVEMGRARLPLQLVAGSADYHTIVFQSRTDLERKSRVEIQ